MYIVLSSTCFVVVLVHYLGQKIELNYLIFEVKSK